MGEPEQKKIKIPAEEIGSFLKESSLGLEKKIGELEEARFGLEEKAKEKTRDLEDSRKALMNILDDVEGSRRALMNILEDVEESKKLIEEEKEKTLLIINNFSDGLMVFSKENILDLINPQAQKIFDIKGRDVKGRSVSELETFVTLKPLIALVGKNIDEIFRKEMKISEKLVLAISVVPIKKGEEETGNLVILHDITREKLVEQMKTEFVSIAAHQLRTPLSAIKWTLRMMLDGDLGEVPGEQKNFIEKCYQSNERMISLINDLLDVTRIEEGRYLYKLTPTNIEDIIQMLITSYKDPADRRQVTLKFQKSVGKVPQADIDVEKIKLTIQNLIDNSIRYTKPGGEVEISVKYGKKEVEVAVRDNGVGIPSDQKDRVFGKFFRAANVMRIDTEGSGLGLFIAKNIIEAHGGRIWFESEEGKGTTFFLAIPLSAKEEFGDFLKKV